MLELGEFIASGTERDVYRHPDKPGRVIKIGRPDSHVDRNAVEHAFYQAAKASTFVGIPKLFGWVETSRGRGLEYELIDDPVGVPSLNVRQLVRAGILTADEVTGLLSRFFDEAQRCGLIIYDHDPGNFLYRRQTDRLILIDGFGPRYWNLRMWFRSSFRVFALKKVRQARKATLLQWQQWCDQVVCTVPRR